MNYSNMDNIDQKKFERVRDEAEEIYKATGEISCPYFSKEKIIFNAKGWEHIRFQGLRQARPHQDQYTRLRLIGLAPKIIQASHTLQGISRRRSLEREKTHGRWEGMMRMATYYEFVAVIKEYRVRVIVKQVEEGPKYFWSIIPFWKMDKISGQRLMFSGKPETD